MRFVVQCSTDGGVTWGGDGDGSTALPVPPVYMTPNGTSGTWIVTANITGLLRTAYLFRVVGLTLYSLQAPVVTAIVRIVACDSTQYPQSSAIACLTADASASDGTYAGLDLLVLSGAGTGARRRVLGYVGRDRAAVLEAPWSLEQSPAPGDIIEVISPGVLQDWTSTQPCSATTNSSSCYGILNAPPIQGDFGLYLRIVRSRSGEAARRVVAYDSILNRIMVSPAYPFPTIGGHLDNQSTRYELQSYVTFASSSLGPINLFGPPAAPLRLTALQIYADGIMLQFIPPSTCSSSSGLTNLPCTATRFLLQARRTYDSSDLRLPGADWTDAQISFVATDTAPSAGSTASALQYRVRGLSPRSSFDIRLAAGADAVPGFGPFSTAFSVKLTEDPPYVFAMLGDMTGLAENEQINLTFTTPSLTVGPPLVSRFSVQFGPTAAELVDFVDSSGNLVTWQRIDVCGRAVDLTRFPFLSPNVTSDLVQCRVAVWGLNPATIYYFKVLVST
jgi:hypothetical protein